MINKIKGARQQLGLSQSQFAAKINTPLPTLQGWESGKKPPGCLLVLIDYLLTDGDKKRNGYE